MLLQVEQLLLEAFGLNKNNLSALLVARGAVFLGGAGHVKGRLLAVDCPTARTEFSAIFVITADPTEEVRKTVYFGGLQGLQVGRARQLVYHTTALLQHCLSARSNLETLLPRQITSPAVVAG